MIENLKKYISKYVMLQNGELEYFASLLEAKTFTKKEYLLHSGSICKYQFFLVKGLVRTYYVDDSGTERIVQFGIENWWVTDMNSFIHQEPSLVNIQAIETTKVLCIRKDRLDQAYAKSHNIERLFRLITEKWLIAQQKHSQYMKSSSKERYLRLVNAIPNFVQRVPQYMIASYLDITPEYLSELRKAH